MPLFHRFGANAAAGLCALGIGLGAAGIPAARASDGQAADTQALAAEARAVMTAFADALRGELQAAMQAGGPVKAITVCNTRAVPLAEQAAAASGWSVGRSSHRLRNPANAPDAFTAQAIAAFQARQASGEKAADLVQAAVVDGSDGPLFRFVKAIPTAEPCLTCHGADLKPEVAAALDTLYPGDMARGFATGEMRGVFTLAKRL